MDVHAGAPDLYSNETQAVVGVVEHSQTTFTSLSFFVFFECGGKKNTYILSWT